MQRVQSMAPPVAHHVLFQSPLLEVRDNRCARRDPALSPATAPLAAHEVVFPRHGLWCRHLGRQALPVDQNHVHFLNRGESHRVSHPNGCGDANTGLLVAADVLREIVARFDRRTGRDAPFRRTHAPVDERTCAAHRLLVAALRRPGAADAMAVEEIALRLVAAAVAQAHRADAVDDGERRAPLPRSQRDLAEAARALLHRRLDAPLRLCDVTAALGSSPFHLCRVFHRHTGSSLHRYRRRLRLHAALGMLVETDAPLVDIAAATGFADRSHLARALARALGCAPGRLRRSARDDPRRAARDLLAAG